MEEKNEEHYKKAISWGEQYLSENKNSKAVNYKKGETINDDIFFVDVQIERIKYCKGKEKSAAYNRLRVFKQFIEKLVNN
jgi:hypothetical protein